MFSAWLLNVMRIKECVWQKSWFTHKMCHLWLLRQDVNKKSSVVESQIRIQTKVLRASLVFFFNPIHKSLLAQSCKYQSSSIERNIWQWCCSWSENCASLHSFIITCQFPFSHHQNRSCWSSKWIHFPFCTNVQRKCLPGPVPDHARKHQQKLRQLQHQPQITVHESEPVLHPQPPGQDCYPLFTQHRFEDYEVIVILMGVSRRLQSST